MIDGKGGRLMDCGCSRDLGELLAFLELHDFHFLLVGLCCCFRQRDEKGTNRISHKKS